MQSVDFVMQQYLDYASLIKGIKPSSVRLYRSIIRNYIQHAGAKTMNDITKESVRTYFIEKRVSGCWKASTMHMQYKFMRAFFVWCQRNAYLASDPLYDIELPKLDVQLPKRLSKQDTLRLLEVTRNYPWGSDYLSSRNYAIISTFIYAGLRKNELVNLRYSDVDFENGTLFVFRGKGGKDRVIPMSTTLALGLQRYAEERRRARKTMPEFFASLHRDQGMTTSGIKKFVERLRKASGIHFTAHQLRHTFATLMIEGGCDIYSLSKMMGHSRITTTTIYLSASAEHLRREITKHPLNEVSHELQPFQSRKSCL